ncbi:DnaJ domain-containing protein [Actinocrispum sp. NPDC049592]|uniref:DnaJ domain-containing protein n=1 Tax=Actinocrispum sp. NPDC049592 TaxID=3154835 RepID=UPI003430A59E
MPPSPFPPRDPYDVLGVARVATSAEIAAAYRALIRALHPDTQHEPADPARLDDVIAAYALLRDPHRRATYDSRHPVAGPPDPISIPVRVHPARPRRQPDIRVGPVRHHPE